MPMDKETKPTLLSIRLKTNITTQQIAQESGVSFTDVYVVEIGGFAEKRIVEKVLCAFSRLSGAAYTMNDIRFQNLPSLQSASEKSRGYVQ